MCGICGAVTKRNAVPLLLEGLHRLEYRGYDSAGIAVVAEDGALKRCRASGKITALESALRKESFKGETGIGHTRWATHGPPTVRNAHPHLAGKVSVVHNGIIENYAPLKEQLIQKGRIFTSDTDTEVVAHLIDFYLEDSGATPLKAVQKALKQLEGAYALGIIFADHPHFLIGARHGAPLAIGHGKQGYFLGSDSLALTSLAENISYLKDGDHCVLTLDGFQIFNRTGMKVSREVKSLQETQQVVDKGNYAHFMEKELHEHPRVINQTLQRFIREEGDGTHLNFPALPFVSGNINRLLISACGSAYYAGLIGRSWIESLARLPVDIDVASELRYRDAPVSPGTALLLVSQSGETADTLGVLRRYKAEGYPVLSLLNAEHSSMERESDGVLGVKAGPEISVASTKAFTAQLTVLAALALEIAQSRHTLGDREIRRRLDQLKAVPAQAENLLLESPSIRNMAKIVGQARDVLFLGRGICMPVAQEGALKLKEITYIHAEAYPAGELKHGPISLIDEKVPVIAIAPSNILFEKTLSNLQEAQARGGKILAFTDKAGAHLLGSLAEKTVILPDCDPFTAPILYAIAVQILAYETALIKGTDVDQPRNLAKSVTVE